MPAYRPGWVTPELVRQTIEVWQPHYDEPLTEDDAVGMLANVGRLLDVLAEERRPVGEAPTGH